jgi:hypothetical protein
MMAHHFATGITYARRSLMHPRDPLDDELRKAENTPRAAQTSDTEAITRVIVDMYPWYGKSPDGGAQVKPASQSEQADPPKQTDK